MAVRTITRIRLQEYASNIIVAAQNFNFICWQDTLTYPQLFRENGLKTIPETLFKKYQERS